MTRPLGLYVHWPFCRAKCPYCDFNSHVRDVIDHDRFEQALLAEIGFEAARTGPRPLRSIFFGGGTPSLMRPGTVAKLIAAACAAFPPEGGIEITLEANPTSVEAANFAGFAAAGVNRVSIGVQALDAADLRMLGRQHDLAEALAAITLARRYFARVSFDLITARPGQTLAGWRAELARALELGCDHFSLYQLTIEPGTAFEAAHRAGRIVLPDPEHAAALYQETGRVAAAAGLERYEISNYARPGAESRHNLIYWRYGEYAGVGPGAHGRLTLEGQRIATRRHRAPEIWAGRVAEHGHGSTAETALSTLEQTREALIMGLRLTEGIGAAAFAEATGCALEAAIDRAILAQAIEAGYLAYDGVRLRALPEGLVRLDALLAALAL